MIDGSGTGVELGNGVKVSVGGSGSGVKVMVGGSIVGEKVGTGDVGVNVGVTVGVLVGMSSTITRTG